MKVTFPRLADGTRAYCVVERPDGVRYRVGEAITAVIVRHDKHIVWRDFGWQDGDKVDGLDGIGPFRFRVSEYRNVLQQVLSGLWLDRWPVARSVAGC